MTNHNEPGPVSITARTINILSWATMIGLLAAVWIIIDRGIDAMFNAVYDADTSNAEQIIVPECCDEPENSFIVNDERWHVCTFDGEIEIDAEFPELDPNYHTSDKVVEAVKRVRW